MTSRLFRLGPGVLVAVFHTFNVLYVTDVVLGDLAWLAPSVLPAFLRTHMSRVDPLTSPQRLYVSIAVVHVVFSALGLIAALATSLRLQPAKSAHKLFLAWAGTFYLYLAVAVAPHYFFLPGIEIGITLTLSVLAFFSLILLIRMKTAGVPNRNA